MLVGMPTTTQPKRFPQAPAAPLPELDEFLQDFLPCFKRRESREALAQYLTGLLTECAHKIIRRLRPFCLARPNSNCRA